MSFATTLARITLATALAVSGAGSALAADITWDERFYNPAVTDDDLILPLPCGGALTFRPVATIPDTADALGDQQVRLGAADEATGHIDYLRRQHLLGAFPAGSHWLYYIAKYEITRDQWQAVTGPECPEPGMGGTLPMIGIAWFDAVDFTRTLSEWLFANATDALPKAGRYTAYVRLPTEAEWEFAARGGTAVDAERFRAATFFEGEPAPEYVWFQGPTSARGALKPVGVRGANPLGLHDVLGNAEEFVLEPFRLNRVGREHGQIGGFITRGGSIQTPEEAIRTALRTEYSFFAVNTGEALALETFGLRPVLSAPVGSSAERADAVAEAWRERRSAGARADAGRDALELLGEVRGRVTDLELAAVLADAEGELAAERRRAEEVAARAARQAILSGAVFGEVIERQTRIWRALRLSVQQSERELQIAQERGNDAAVTEWQDELAGREERFARADADLQAQRRAFLETVYTLADDHGAAELAAQSALLGEELRLAAQPETAATVARFEAILLAYVEQPELTGDEIIARLLEDRP